MCEEGNFVMGANIAGFLKVADAMLAQGVCLIFARYSPTRHQLMRLRLPTISAGSLFDLLRMENNVPFPSARHRP